MRGSQEESPEPVRWKLVGLGCVALLAAVAYQWVYVESALRRPPAPDREEVLAAYRTLPRQVLPVTADDPHLGPLDAPVRLVVFESLRCSACRSLSATLSRLRLRYRDKLLIAYKHYPLSSQCNGRLDSDQQPGACEMAWAAEAAHRQARFWPFHDALLAAGAETNQAISDAARRLKLDPARFASDRASAATRDAVARDVALGDRLKIPGTPAVFLEGRLVRPPTERVLEVLIRYELERHVAGSSDDERRALDAGRSRKGRLSRGG
jgi:protein-disulfide isomerase